MKVDCIHYENEKCAILKKLYCKSEKCTFYKQDKIKAKKEESKRKKYSKFYNQKYKLNKDNKIKYINYGELIFSDEEIKALKSRKLKIY